MVPSLGQKDTTAYTDLFFKKLAIILILIIFKNKLDIISPSFLGIICLYDTC